jgi:putative oxidoreductase
MATSSMTADLNWADAAPRGPAQAQAKGAARISKLGETFARVALGAAFLSSVADRFGLWGFPGKPSVDWGDFRHFTQYTGMVNSFLPARVIPAVAWAATIAETTFGLSLILGIYKRAVAGGSAALLLMFALAMTISFGIKAPLGYSVFTASAAAFLLFARQSERAKDPGAESNVA